MQLERKPPRNPKMKADLVYDFLEQVCFDNEQWIDEVHQKRVAGTLLQEMGYKLINGELLAVGSTMGKQFGTE